jgi:hypothetical protein
MAFQKDERGLTFGLNEIPGAPKGLLLLRGTIPDVAKPSGKLDCLVSGGINRLCQEFLDAEPFVRKPPVKLLLIRNP